MFCQNTTMGLCLCNLLRLSTDIGSFLRLQKHAYASIDMQEAKETQPHSARTKLNE